LSGPPSLQLGVSSESCSPARAFSAPRGFELQLPEFDPAAVAHWAAVAAPSFHPWYVLRMRLGSREATETLTLLLTCDRDVIESIEDLAPVAVDSLLCLQPPTASEPSSLRLVEIREIWAPVSASGSEAVFVEHRWPSDGPDHRGRAPIRPGLELLVRIGPRSFVRRPAISKQKA